MPLPALLLPILVKLAESGLETLAGAIQSKGKEFVEEKIGVKIPDKAEDLTQGLIVQLKVKQIEHEEFLVGAALEETKSHLADRQNARGRDVELTKAGRNNFRGDVLAYGAIGALLVTILLLFFVKVPTESRDILLIVLGSLVVIVKDVYGFEFGSSKDSQRNAQAVADVLKNGG